MRKLIIVSLSIVLIMGVGTGSASAQQNSLKEGAIGFSVGLGNSVFGDTYDSVIDVTGKYLISNELALLAGIGFETHGGDADGSYLGFTLGARKYLDTDDFVPFIEGKLMYITQDVNGDTDVIDISVGFGAEYFMHKQLSIEASVGIGLGIEDNNITNQDDVYFGTRTIGVKASFYF